MTVQRTFYNYQRMTSHPMDDEYSGCSPNLLLLRDYLRENHQMAWSGCFALRGIKKGVPPGTPSNPWSTHARGAAIDMRYVGTGVDGYLATLGRTRLVQEVIPWLIDWSAELGVQAIHDYAGNRIWRAWRPANEGGPGWKQQGGAGDFRPGNTWVHIETTPTAWFNKTPIEHRIIQPWDPPRSYATWPQAVKPTLVVRGDNPWPAVLYLQSVLVYEAGQDIERDGIYGPDTKQAVGNLQQLFNLFGTSPSFVSKHTWDAVDFLAVFKPGSS